MRNNPGKNYDSSLTKWKLTTFYIFIVSFALTAGAIDEKVSSPLPTSATSSKQSTTSLAPSSSSTYSTNEEIYIDDEGVGSGHGGIHEDLEKNSDYSGSGFGPDDEDSIGNTNSRNNNKNKNIYDHPLETGGTFSSNKYNNIGVGGNNNNNNGNEQHPTSISSTTSSTSTTRHNKPAPIPSNSDLSFDVDREDDKNDNDDEYESSGDDFDDNGETTDTDHDDDKGSEEKLPTDNGNTEHASKNDDDNGDDKHDDSINPNNKNNNEEVEDDYEDEDDLIGVGKNHDYDYNTTEIQPNMTDSSNKDIIINNNNEVVPGEEIGRTNLNPPGGVNPGPNEVLIMNEERTTSFFAQPGILAAVIGGAVVGLLCAILVVMFIVYRMRKKDEGSYALDEPKRSPAVNSYAKNGNNREFYA